MIALLAWLHRYEYQVVEISPGIFYQIRRNTWTDAVCVAWVSASGHIPPGLAPCNEEDR